jgi:AcrR family transcriptional regulator
MRPAKLDREQILAATVALIDEHGLEALSMRRLGQELGVEAMSLYRHTANKSQLLDGVHETILDSMVIPELCGDWQLDLRALAGAFYNVLQAHPKAISLFATRPATTPKTLRHVERILEVLTHAGFDLSSSIQAFQLVFTYVVGHAQYYQATMSQPETPDVRYHLLPREEFPLLSQLQPVLADSLARQEFTFGLDVMLLGLQAKLES